MIAAQRAPRRPKPLNALHWSTMPALPTSWFTLGLALCAALPPLLMLLLALWPQREAGPGTPDRPRLWRRFRRVCTLALLLVLGQLLLIVLQPLLAPQAAAELKALGQPWLQTSLLGAALALLVQLLGTVIAAFSSRYLEGEARQGRYAAALAGVLAAVHLLLLADHWLPLILAWALVGVVLERLLCFYASRPFARLAAHKKRLADRLADVLLLAAAGLAWQAVGSGSFEALRQALQAGALNESLSLQLSAVLLVLAVMLRSALLPVHGWLIQVMEAPTPVSALLHAGVVNLGGVVLIRFVPLLEQAPLARGLLVVAGLATALLAGLVMLTRISIKVRLAWSTVAQMGFMLMECGLGLYTLAALHLIGHSLYKAHAFLSASEAVREARLRALRPSQQASAASLWLAPLLSAALVGGLALTLQPAAWPWWWSSVLALAWAPMLWWSDRESALTRLAAALPMLAGLALAALLLHGLPLGLQDRPFEALGPLVLAGMAGLYLGLALLQRRPEGLSGWRRWSYAGFYLDEIYTRLTLRLWPTRWTPAQAPHWRGASPSLATHQP